MKRIVLYIDTMYRGGAQRVMSNIISYLDHNNWEIVLCNDFVADPNILQYTVPSRVKRVYLSDTIQGNVILKNIKRMKNLRRSIIEEKPNCVLSFLGRPNLRLLIATIGLKVPKIVSVRNDPKREYDSKVKAMLAKQLFKTADGIVFQTSDARQFFPISVQKKSEIIFNPVDEVFYQAKAKENCKNIITVGRLMPQKNQKCLIDAFSKIASLFPEQRLIIYGDGPLLDELLDYAKEKNVSQQVVFPGSITNVENYLAESEIFVLSSDYEGMPNALMEAMAVGVACISTDCPCGGPNTIIQDGVIGFLVPVGDADAISEKLRYLLEKPDMRKAAATEAKKSAAIFKSETIMKKWMDYITSICTI